jgi:cell division protein FtsZ
VKPIHAEPIVAQTVEATPIVAAPIHAQAIEVEPIEVAEDDGDWEEVAAEEDLEQELAEPVHAAEETHKPELIPVPRSVFDDDFFRASARELLAPTAPLAEPRMPSARGFESNDALRPVRLHFDETRTAEPLAEPTVAEPMVRVPVFSGAVTREPAEADELDIPAFLRRGH